jgi:hypothetical protein
MSVGTATAIAIGTTAAAGLGSAAIGAHAANKAAQTQADAANQANQLQYQEFQQQQANLAPWLKTGTQALSQLSNYPSFTATGLAQNALNPSTFTPTGAALNALNPGTFQAPTAEQAAATPGYQFAFDQGLQALQRSQAATGITGGAAAKAAEQYGQGLASTNYQQAYNNALQSYNTNQGAAQQALAGQSGVYGQNLGAALQALSGQQGVYGMNLNRIANIAGMGENAVSQLNAAGQNYATNAGNLLTSKGAAQAAGQVGAANAYGQGLGTIGNLAQTYGLMNYMGYGQPSFNTGQNYADTGYAGDVTNQAVANAINAYAPSLTAPAIGTAQSAYNYPTPPWITS